MAGAYHLGIVSQAMPLPKGGVDLGVVGVFAGTGWGFGNDSQLADKQQFAWEGQRIVPTVFEISVKAGPLTEAERQNLKE
jgi:hypothetical protein